MDRKGFSIAWNDALRIVILLGMVALGRWDAEASNNQFASATMIYGITNFTTSNVGATAEPDEPRHAGEAPENTLWWKWTVPFTATFSVVTSNSMVSSNVPLDTVAAVYTGSSLSALSLVAANDDTPYGDYGALWSRCVFRAYAGESLMIVVGSLGATGTIRCSVDLAGPIIYPFQATGLHGKSLFSTNFSGQVLMIDFWETICGACVEELPALVSVQNYFSPRGFTFIGLSGDANVDDVVNYVADSPINYPIAMSDTSIQTSLAGQPVGYPTKILVDREGRNVGIYIGGNTEKGYRAIIEPLLRSNPMVRANISAAGESVKIRWPSSETGMIVESTPQLPGGSWSNVTASPMVTNGENVVTVPASTGAQFFRLKRP